jgi:methylamine dehydrogenase heavy chain
MKRLTVIGCVGLGLAQAAFAQDPIEPETLTVEAHIAPGPNVFSLDQSWSGASKINVLGADDLSMKGNITPGLTAQMVLSADGKTLYTMSDYPKRIISGPTESVVAEWDVDTLTLKREIIVPSKAVMVEPQPAMLSLVDDGKYMLVQNATPATSVTVVDLAAGAPIAEVPTPGCWGAIPAPTGMSFLSLCGDGSMQVSGFAADGTVAEPKKTPNVFDVDKDALFTNPARAGNDLLFMSFGGAIYDVAFGEDGAATLAGTFSITEGTEGWAPGGSEVIAYHPETGVAFVLMHPDAAEGSHKDPAKEIWAVDVAGKKLLYRSTAHDEKSITVSKSSPPVLFAASDDEAIVTRYDVDPDAKSAAKLTATAEDMGGFVGLVLTTE